MTADSPRLLRRREVQARTGLSRSALYAAASRGEFPRPISIGARAVAWIESEVATWIAERIREGRHQQAAS